jgi:hypothetical protein
MDVKAAVEDIVLLLVGQRLILGRLAAAMARAQEVLKSFSPKSHQNN